MNKKNSEKALKSKTAKVVIKEIRFGPTQTTMTITLKKHAEKFLNKAKLKALFFKGRSIIF